MKTLLIHTVILMVWIVSLAFFQKVFSQTESPIQPEYSMPPAPSGPHVNEFTGDFSYGLPLLTVPGPNGSDYTITLSYHAGSSPDNVSWVGYGWSLNTGAIIRNKRGFPDDWSDSVVYYNKMPTDYTVSGTYFVNFEAGSGDATDDPFLSTLGVTASVNITEEYNNRTGYHDIIGVGGGASFLGNYAGLEYMNTDGTGKLVGVLSPNLWMTGALFGGFNPRSNKFVNRLIANTLRYGNTSNVFTPFKIDLGSPVSLPIIGSSDNYGSKFGVGVVLPIFVGADIGASGNVTDISTRSPVNRAAYGYLQSHLGQNDESGIMDFAFANDFSFAVNDNLLPVPFSNADEFHVVGGGTFRAYNRGVGGFHQNTMSSEIDVNNLEISGHVGLNGGWGIGGRWGDGSITYESGKWLPVDDQQRYKFNIHGDEPWLFRYAGDRGGSLLFDRDDSPVQARIREDSDYEYDYYPDLPNYLGFTIPAWERPGRSSYIGLTSNAEMLEQSNGSYTRAHTKDYATRKHVKDVDRMKVPEGIGEFVLSGSDGGRFTYGLPVYVQKEQSVSLGIENITINSPEHVRNNFLAYSPTSEHEAATVLGYRYSKPYAAAWLLTQATTSDYVDLTGNGPSDDDYGGWTRFSYQSERPGYQYGLDFTLRKPFFRSPLNGLRYDIGELSDPKDDLGSYTSGYYDLYLPDTIATRTHYARFITNDYVNDPRKDRYDNVSGTRSSEVELAADSTVTTAKYRSSGTPASNIHKYLDRIELYARNPYGGPDSLLLTVRFEYDYSLRSNMVNSLPVHPDSLRRYGVLTLKKVWTERQGVRNAQIHPYIFGYEYKKENEYAASVRSRYPAIASFADSLTSSDQNPEYSPYDFDRWGFYQRNGGERYAKLNPWVQQVNNAHFDPAAWQLKSIRLPSGGEVHIQYEQDDYSFVQDRPAMAMVSLKESAGGGMNSLDQNNTNKYYFNLADIGVDSSSYTQVARLRELIEDVSSRSGKLLFRFLYALKGTQASLSQPQYNSEYIEGYANLHTVGIDSVGSGGPYGLYVKLASEDGTEVPRRACRDFVRTHKQGKLQAGESVEFESDASMILNLLLSTRDSYNPDNHCQAIDYANSYIRIPLLFSKKGGGLRVKRLLSYDPGIEGDSMLYGTEYRYEVFDPLRNEVVSSGVAVNEPVIGRSENALVDYMKNIGDDMVDRVVIVGAARGKYEGPISEALLPSASVGYSRVVSHPIHQGLTAPGFSVSDFHTAKEYPFDMYYEGTGRGEDYTDLDAPTYQTPFYLENWLFYRQFHKRVRATQGYRFIQNEMHGAPRRSFVCGGRYTSDERQWLVNAMSEYLYFPLGDSIPLSCRIGDTIRYGYPGKEMELIHGSRRQAALINDGKIEGDVSFITIIPASGTVMGYFAEFDTELFTHVITKTVSYPAILKGVVSYADGNYSYVENVAFDPTTGQPVITRTDDAYTGLATVGYPGPHSGSYYNYTIPAARYYPSLGRRSDNDRSIIRSEGTLSIGKRDSAGITWLEFPRGRTCHWMSRLTPGDVVDLRLKAPPQGQDSLAGIYHVDSVGSYRVWLSRSHRLMAVNSPDLSDTGVVHVEVLHSGRRNLPGAAVGSITTYGEHRDDVINGTGFGFVGVDLIDDRWQFVELLNTALVEGIGTINSGSSISPELKFISVFDQSCGSLGEEIYSVDLMRQGSQVVLGVFGQGPDFVLDTLQNSGKGGYFTLDDQGQVVYRAIGEDCCQQRVSLITFCGDTAYRSVNNVIGATAMVLGESNTNVTTVNGNSFERGARGRWLPRTSYIYRTTVQGGSRPDSGQRVYKQAGVLDDFTLFSWNDPRSTDWTRWMRSDSVTQVDRHNRPIESRDLLNRPSTIAFGYGQQGDDVPEHAAWNAQKGAVAFTSFEEYATGAVQGDIVSDVAHSGVNSSTGVGFYHTLICDDHILDKGLLVRFWMYPLDSINPVVRLETVDYTVDTTYRVARSGHWALYEYEIPAAAIDALYDPGQEITIAVRRNDPAHDIRIDDIKIQPTDAVVVAQAYDRKTYRPLYSIDDGDFSMSPTYNAEGSPIAMSVETSRGTMTVGEVYAHLPATSRAFSGEGSPVPIAGYGGLGPDVYARAASGHSDYDIDTPDNTFDILDFELGPQGHNVKLFGMEPSELRELLVEKVSELQFPTPEELRFIDRYVELEQRIQRLNHALADTSASEPRAAQIDLDRELKGLKMEQENVLDRLGLNRSDVEHYIRESSPESQNHNHRKEE